MKNNMFNLNMNSSKNGTELVRRSVPAVCGKSSIAKLNHPGFYTMHFPPYLTSHSSPQNLKIYFNPKREVKLNNDKSILRKV